MSKKYWSNVDISISSIENNVDLYNFDIINQEISRNSIMQAAKTNNFSELNSAIDSN